MVARKLAKVCLCREAQGFETEFFAPLLELGEVYIRGDVLLSGARVYFGSGEELMVEIASQSALGAPVVECGE